MGDILSKDLKTINLAEIKDFISDVEAFFEKNDVDEKDRNLTFSYFMTRLYPDLYINFCKQVSQQYTLGYIDGLKDGRNENNRTD